MFLVAVHFLFFYLSFYSPNSISFFVSLSGCGLIILYTPLLYVYSYTLIKGSLPKRWYLHFLPYLFFVITIYLFFIHHIERYTFEYAFLKIQSKGPFLLRQYGIYFAVVTGIYTFALLSRTWSYDKNLKSFLSYEEGVNLERLRKWSIVALLFFIFIFILINLSVETGIPARSTTFQWVGYCIIIYILVISLVGIKQSTIFQNPVINHNQKTIVKQYKNSGLTPEGLLIQGERIKRLMITNKYYLDRELSLPLLAKMFDISSSNLSQIINQHFKQNFFDFVNYYRVEEFKLMVNDPSKSKFSILGIAFECGFKSKSSFNKTFKRFTGQNPSSFQKK